MSHLNSGSYAKHDPQLANGGFFNVEFAYKSCLSSCTSFALFACALFERNVGAHTITIFRSERRRPAPVACAATSMSTDRRVRNRTYDLSPSYWWPTQVREFTTKRNERRTQCECRRCWYCCPVIVAGRRAGKTCCLAVWQQRQCRDCVDNVSALCSANTWSSCSDTLHNCATQSPRGTFHFRRGQLPGDFSCDPVCHF